MPDCVAAALVGSAAVRNIERAADLDITCFDWNVPVGSERHAKFELGGMPVHAVAYHPNYFLIVSTHNDLILPSLREIRKLLEGKILFDDEGVLETVLASLKSISIPRETLKPFVAAVQSFKLDSLPAAEARLFFYYAVENLAFGWMNADLKYRYSKPKWLLEDAALIPSKSLFLLLRAISEELITNAPLPELIQQLRLMLDRDENAGMPSGVPFHLKDAETLVHQGLALEAVWPLRMSAYQYGQFQATQLGIAYRDLRSITTVMSEIRLSQPHLFSFFETLLLTNSPVSETLLELFEQAATDFLTEWNNPS